MEKRERFFIPAFLPGYNKQNKYFEKLDLLNEKLVVRKLNKDGTYRFEPLLYITAQDRTDILAQHLKYMINNEVLLLEITEKQYIEKNIKQSDVLLFSLKQDKSYEEIKKPFNKRTIELLEIDVLPKLKKIPSYLYEVVDLIPNPLYANSLYLIKCNNLKQTNKKINDKQKLSGVGSYVKTSEKALIDKYRTYKVIISEEEEKHYEIKSKNHYFLKPLSDFSVTELSEKERMLYSKIEKEALLVIQDKKTNKLSFSLDEDIINGRVMYYIDRPILDEILNNQDNSNLKENIITLNQNQNNYNEISLEESLDVLKTNTDLNNAFKPRIFIEYNLGDNLPEVLKNKPLNIMEMEKVYEDPFGEPIYKASHKIFSSRNLKEESMRMQTIGHFNLIDITDLNLKEDIINKFYSSGLIRTFELYETEELPNIFKNIFYYKEIKASKVVGPDAPKKGIN